MTNVELRDCTNYTELCFSFGGFPRESFMETSKNGNLIETDRKGFETWKNMCKEVMVIPMSLYFLLEVFCWYLVLSAIYLCVLFFLGEATICYSS